MKYVLYAVISLLPFALFAADESTGALHGTILGRDTAKNQLIVAHADVKGLMPAMTMPYEVRDAKVASLPKDGTKITAVLHSANGAFWLTGVKAVSAGSAAMPEMKMDEPAHQEMPGMAMDQPMRHGTTGMPPDMPGMHMSHDATSELLMRQASGTAMNPAAAEPHMEMTHAGDWMLMLHGLAFVSQVMQSGPRGGDKIFSSNWLMGMADRPLGGGHLMLRSMLSLEPLTIGKKYPELFQTGETIDGRPIVDGQHPHDFFMELAAEYAHPIDANTIAYVYAAPMGDPALGPVAYPHRASASEIPQATLSHHVQDSTHIAGSVVTVGAQRGELGLGISGFHGREPDENRWNLDTGRLDSWSARLTYDPTPQWSAQISTGHLTHPEAAEPGNVQRTTASVAYSAPTAAGEWNTSLIFGHNKKSEGHSVSSWLAETTLRFLDRNYLTARAEIVDKDELFAGENVPPSIANGVFRIRALTVGYSRDLLTTAHVLGAAGVNATAYSIPGAIEPYYGHPHSIYLFARFRGR